MHLKSAEEYRANGTITNLVHEFLASSLGRYREFIKSPSQGAPRTPATIAANAALLRSPSTGANDLESAGSQTPPMAQTPPTASGEAPPLTPGSRASSVSEHAWEEETIIRGDNGFRFYHSAFAASFASKANREFAGALIHTQMWQVLANRIILIVMFCCLLLDCWVSSHCFDALN